VRVRNHGWLLFVGLSLVACKPDGSQSKVSSAELTPLSPEEQLVRVSMALRGVRPSSADLALVQTDPDALMSLAQAYAESDDFATTAEDLFAEVLRMRSIELQLPNVIGDAGVYIGSQQDVRHALAEEPLRIVGEVVRQDMPLTTLVTADWTVLDDVSSEIWSDHDYDPEQGGVQVVSHTDGRPAAGVLSTNGFLLRHESNGGNFNRGRSSVLSETFLCDVYSNRDIPIAGALTDPDAVAAAINTDPACVACHQSVDPIAATFFPLRNRLDPNQITGAYDRGCEDLSRSQSCYPVSMYYPEYANYWQEVDMRAPGYFGADAADLQDVGAHIAQDPRFSSCMARRFAAYLTQRPIEAVPAEEVAALQQVLLDSQMSARALAVAVVTNPSFLASEVGTEPTELQIIRPEQLDRMVEDLTGLHLAVAVNDNVGDIPLMADDVLGFRAMSGGIDGASVTLPTHQPTPTKLLTIAALAEEGAGHVVDHDLAASSGERRLLMTVDSTTTDEDIVRAELVHLHGRIFGTIVTPNSPDVDDALALWQAVADADSPQLAWKTVIAAMLQSPEVLFY